MSEGKCERSQILQMYPLNNYVAVINHICYLDLLISLFKQTNFPIFQIADCVKFGRIREALS